MRLINFKNGLKPKAYLISAALLASLDVFAGPPQPSALDNSLAVTLLIIAIFLLLAIALLAYVLIGAAEVYLERFKEKKAGAGNAVKTLLVLGLITLSSSVFAQDAAATDAAQADVVTTIGGLSQTSFYILVSVIGVEILVLMVMLYFLKVFIMKEKPVVAVEERQPIESLLKKWWMKINKFKPIREEQDIMLDHDYDGIRELDNRLPPWWLYGFYVSIIFSAIYLFRYHVAHSAPLPAEELAISFAKAEAAKEEYLKNAAGKVDENTVVLLTTADDLAEGSNLFATMCAPCHGPQGQGAVGPNLTDDYWLHKGGVKDIFKTIKYGVPEKGMRAWMDDFSPTQIARITSYIKSIHGTNPPNPKEPQGELFKEENTAVADSAAPGTVADTTGVKK